MIGVWDGGRLCYGGRWLEVVGREGGRDIVVGTWAETMLGEICGYQKITENFSGEGSSFVKKR